MARIDPKKRARLVKLAKTGLYSKADIKEDLIEKFGSSINEKTFDRILAEEKITLPGIMETERGKKIKAAESAAKSKYLKNYTFDDLETDIKAGKSRTEIVDDILKKNPSNIKDIRRLTLSALASRLIKRPDLAKLDFVNEKNLIKEKRNALKDLKSFVNKNKEAYKKVYASNKVGAVSGFKEKVLDYISQNYPKLINRSKGGRDILTGQRIFTGFDLLGRDVTRKGEYGRDLELNKIIRKSLGIPERPLKGEGESINRLNRAYNKNITNLLKEAQKQGKVPLIDPKTGSKINSEAAYSRYIDRKVIDPVRNLFGKYFKFGTEHMGGVARANLINDTDALNQIAALDTFTNKFDKGAKVDQKVTTLLKLAKQSSGDKARDYLEIANKLLKESDAKYGLDSTKYKLVKNEIIPIQPNEENIFKRAVTAFTATERYKDPNFKLLDPDLKQSIMAFKKGSVEKGTKFLKSAVQTLISKTENLSKADQLRFCSLLANGGLPGDCKQAIKTNPEKAAQVLSDAPATNKAAAEVKDSAQKLIRLYRGIEPDKQTELYKATKSMPGMYEESLKGRFFFDNPADARYYAQRQGTTTGKVLSVDVPENMVNIGKKMAVRRRGPNLSGEVILPKKFVGKETVNIPQTAFARAQAITEGVTDKLKWDNIVGAFTTKDGDIASQADIKTYAADNPMEVKVGEEPVKAATNKSVLSNVGKAMARVGAPLPVAAIDAYFIGQQVKEGKGTAEIASNPLNWLGLATMEPLAKASGIAEGGGLNKALRLGLNPATIRGITRFAGLPGLAVSTAMTAYDQYQKYKDGEGFIFNLLNQKGTE